MLVHARRIIAAAYRAKHLAIAFNTMNAETTLAVARAASTLGRGTLFEISEKTISYLGLGTVVAMTEAICRDPAITAPLALHLDHGHSVEICRAAVRAGFSSVMFDGSALPFKENVRLTRQVVRFAHAHGVWVQGEIGALVASRRGSRVRVAAELMTDPAQAAAFVKLTGVDTLGVAVGTLHGPMKIFHKLPHIDFPRIAAITRATRTPLVLHGASGVPAADLRRAARLGVAVANIDTDLRLTYLAAMRRELARQKKEYDPRVVFGPVVSAVQALAESKLRSVVRS